MDIAENENFQHWILESMKMQNILNNQLYGMSLGLMNQNMVIDKNPDKENGDTNCQTTPLNRPGTLTNSDRNG